jgi:hypothetical protein
MYHRLLRISLFVLVLCLWATMALAGPPPPSSGDSRPVVVRAEVDGVEPDRLVIRGANFGARSTPVVLLSRIPLEVLSFSDQQIVAKLPVDVPSARYRLQVLAAGVSSSPLFEVTLGPRPRRGSEG